MLGYHRVCYNMLKANMLSTTVTLLEKCPLVSGAILAHKPLPFSALAALPPQKGLHRSQLITIILIVSPPVRLTSSTLATLKLKPSPPADTPSLEDSALNPPEFNPSQITAIPSPGGRRSARGAALAVIRNQRCSDLPWSDPPPGSETPHFLPRWKLGHAATELDGGH